MSTLAVARRYATALVQLTAEEGTLGEVEKDLARVAALVTESPELGDMLTNAAFKAEERRAVLDVVLGRLGVHRHTRNFMFVLNDRNRLAALSAIVDAFGDLSDVRTGRVRAHVTSAKGLDAASIKTLRDHLQNITGAKEVIVREDVDPELLGGIVTRIGDLVLDGSVRTQLQLLRDQLVAGQSAGEA